MKKIKWLVFAAAATAMFAANAAFRVASPSAAIKRQTAMAMQSAAGASAAMETMAETTREEPYAVDFAALGAGDGASLLVVNEQTGSAIAVSGGEGEKTLALPPLALAELEMRHLGAAQSYRALAVAESPASGKEEILSSVRLASALGTVEFPQFAYRADDGEIKLTTTAERSLVGFSLVCPVFCLADDATEESAAATARLSEEQAEWTYIYALPDGREVTYREGAKKKAAAGGFGAQAAAACKFQVYYSATTPTAAKVAFAEAVRLWDGVLAGDTPVAIYVDFYDMGDPHVLGSTWTCRTILENTSGNRYAFPTAAANQILGFDTQPDYYAFEMAFNTAFPWYYGTDGNAGSKYDLVTVLLHEISHGLGFAGGINPSSGAWYYGCPTTFDWCLTCLGYHVPDLTAESRAFALVSDALRFDGAKAATANGGKGIDIYAPYTYNAGSSGSHWDEDIPFGADTFMRYHYVKPIHTFNPVKLGAMADIGWSLRQTGEQKPPAPGGVAATQGTLSGAIDISWGAVSGATSYTVYRAADASGQFSVRKAGATACAFRDDAVSGASKWYYKVSASNSAGEGALSSSVAGWPKSEPVLERIAISSGPATLTAGESADYTCTAYYRDGEAETASDVSLDPSCEWSLPYGANAATLSGRRLSAGQLTTQGTATLRACFGDKTAEKQITILPATVEVAFDALGGGQCEFARRTYTVGAQYGTLPEVGGLARTAEFLGWFTAPSGGTLITEDSIVSGAVTKLYAQYGKVVVTESLRLDAPESVECGERVVVRCYATDSEGVERELFGGMHWTVKATGFAVGGSNGEALALESSPMTEAVAEISASMDGVSSGTITVRAVHPLVAVALDANGGSVSPSVVTQRVSRAWAALPAPQRAGHDFLGWWTELSGGAKIVEGTVFDGSYSTLRARWERKVELSALEISGPSRVVSGEEARFICTALFTDGSKMENVAAEWTATGGKITVQGVFTAPFATEATSAAIAARYIAGGIEKRAEKALEIVPATVEVAFDSQGGSVAPASQTFIVGLAYGELPVPVRETFDFAGWFTASAGGRAVDAATIAAGDVTTLYARWEKTLSSISVSGPSSVEAGASARYGCTAYFSDGSSLEGVSAVWSVSAGEIDATGLFTAPAATAESSIVITAAYTAKGETRSARMQIGVTPKMVTVGFDAGGGTVEQSARAYIVGLAYGSFPAARRAGWVFDGWYTASGADGECVSVDTVATEEVRTLYAKWHEEIVLSGLTILGPAALTSGESAAYSCRANYSDGSVSAVQADWSIVAGGDAAAVEASGVVTAGAVVEAKTAVLRAEFSSLAATVSIAVRPRTVEVAFEANGGECAEASRIYIVGARYGALPSAVREGWRFAGWWTAAEAGERILESSEVSAAVARLYAHWEETEPELLGIAISAQEGEASVKSGETLMLACTATWSKGGETVQSALNGSEVAWRTDDALAGTVAPGGLFSAGFVTARAICNVVAEYEGVESAPLAIWVEPEKATVAFHANGGMVSPASAEYTVGLAYGALPVPVNGGDYIFEGWFTALEGGARVTEETICEKTVAALYAHWAKKVVLEALAISGQSVVTSGVACAYSATGIYSDGSALPLTACEWAVESVEQGAFAGDGVFTAAFVPGETRAVVIANYGGVEGRLEILVEPLEVSVRFDPCNGVVRPERMAFIAGSAYGELPTPVRSRYDFDGWWTREAKAGERIEASSIVEPSADILYAGWTPVQTTLTGIRIEGPETITSGGFAVLTCKAVYSDGSVGSVVPQWSLVGGLDYASLTAGGYLEAVEVDSARSVSVQAVYTYKGVRYEDSHAIAIVPGTLAVDPHALSLEAGEQTAAITIDAWGAWTARTDASWLTLEKTSGAGFGELKFAVAANEGASERLATITVTDGALEDTCVVKQFSPVPDEYVSVTLWPEIKGQGATQRQYIKGRKFGYLPTPVRQGYAFGGWWTKKGGKGERVHAMSIVTDETKTLYAYWADVSVAYALNNALDWVEDAANPWKFDYADAVDRKVAMVSPNLGNGEASSLRTVLEGPGDICFYWKTSSERYFDTLAFYIDGRFIAAIDGETPWTRLVHAVEGFGQHVLEWRYAKDGQGADGMDAAWLDMVTWSPDYGANGIASIQGAGGRSVPESWLNAYGLETTPHALDDDADGDGMSNWAEYVAGTDPADAESKLQVFINFDEDGLPVIEAFPDLGDTANRRYIREGRAELGSDEEGWEPADETIHRFFRVRIEKSEE